MGNYKLKCPKSKSTKGTGKQSEKEETVLITIEGGEQPCEDIWIVDLATLTHIVNNEEGLFNNVKAICKPIKIGDGKLVYATKVGWLKVSYTNYVGENEELVLENIQYIPGFWVNLFSLTAAMSKGCLISNKEWMIVVLKNTLLLKFNKEIKMKNGFVCSILLSIKPGTDCMLTTLDTTNHCRPLDINLLHQRLGHASKALMQKTAKFYGWQLKNLFKTYKSCTLAKLHQNDTNKEKKVPEQDARQVAIC